jgi:hypothetical protein
MLFAPTNDPGNDILLGSIFTDRGRSLFTDVGSLYTAEDEMLPPYLGGS